jgi:hypothetical protein
LFSKFRIISPISLFVLTIIIRDPAFRYIIDYCVERGSYQNIPLKQVQEWREGSTPVSIPPSPLSSSTSSTSSSSSKTTPNGTSTTDNNTSPPSTPTNTPPKAPFPPSAKWGAKPPSPSSSGTLPLDNATNQEREDVLVAASRVLTQHNPLPVTSKAASVATPSVSQVTALHRDELLRVLTHVFDPARPAAGRDPTALAPLFAHGNVAEYGDELVIKIVEAGTRIGRDESWRACGVLKVLSDYVPKLPEMLIRMYVSQFFNY